MASGPLLTAEAAHARHIAERQKAAEVAERYPGWHVWCTRDGRARVATRTGSPQPPEDDDSTWCLTVIEDDWPQLEKALAAQAS